MYCQSASLDMSSIFILINDVFVVGTTNMLMLGVHHERLTSTFMPQPDISVNKSLQEVIYTPLTHMAHEYPIYDTKHHGPRPP